ncbi:MAG: hypothetical protein CMO74_12240 [Verrucomicrobiales bacterium]|nr:hypothetical protein [Verrucomicrobiales bacterium]|tara:strand:- start:21458 stop:26794 length:5337 start_codon:yes stop_codon:yes gene_type:complete
MSKGKRNKGRKKKPAEAAPVSASEPKPEPKHSPEPPPEPKPEGAALFQTASAPFFKRTDWLAFAAATVVTLLVYLYTLAPNVTLEDSGELATASMYAGVPHAPGYPLWTIYSWAFTKIIPFGNMAWRVGISSAVAAALACGLTALMISRGSRLFFDSIESLRGMAEQARQSISVAAGFAGGAIFGFSGFMWSQAVIVEVYTLSTFTFAGVLCLLMRWYFIPERNWALYAAYLVFGLCLANHQTLLLAAVAIELLILMRHREIGRDLFICNSLIYLAGLLYFATQPTTTTSGKLVLFGTFNLVGVGCLLLAIWHSLPRPVGTSRNAPLFLGTAYALTFLILGAFWITFIWPIGSPLPATAAAVLDPSRTVWDLSAVWQSMGTSHRMILLFFLFIAGASILALSWLAWLADQKSTRSLIASAVLFLFLAMGLPWMWHLLQSRGTLLPGLPPEAVQIAQAHLLGHVATANKITLAYVLLSILMLTGVLGLNWSRQRDRAFAHWLPLLATRAAALGGLLFYFFMPLSSLTNPPMNWAYPRTAEGFKHAITRGQYTGPAQESTDQVSRFLIDVDGNGRIDGGQVGVFISETLQEFNPAYTLLALLPLGLWWYMRERERRWLGGMFLIFVSLTLLMIAFRNPGGSEQQRHLNKVFFEASHLFVALGLGWGLALGAGLIVQAWEKHRRELLTGASILCALELLWWPFTQTSVSATPASLLFTLASYDAPVLIAAAGIGVLFAGGLCGLLALRRPAAPMGLLLALICLLPARHGLANWWDNELRGHYFGYWYGRDMFATDVKDENGDLIYPPMARDAVLFGGTDAGRFCPTYMIFCESLTPPQHRTDKSFDRRDVYIITQNALADARYLDYIRAHYNRSQQRDPYFLRSFHNRPGVQPVIDLVSSNQLDYIRRQFAADSSNGMRLVSNYIARLPHTGISEQALLQGMSTNKGNMPSHYVKDLVGTITNEAQRKAAQIILDELKVTEDGLLKLEETANQSVSRVSDFKMTALRQPPFEVTKGVAELFESPDEWIFQTGESVEYGRQTQGVDFVPGDFRDIEALARILKEEKTPATAHVKSLLARETQSALTKPDDLLEELLIRDFNKILHDDFQAHRQAARQLAKLEKREADLLQQFTIQTSSSQADQVFAAIELLMKRQDWARRLAFHCRFGPKAPAIPEIRASLERTDAELRTQYQTLIAGEPTVLKEIQALSKQRRETASRLCNPRLAKPGLFVPDELDASTAALLRQNPWTASRPILNRRLLEHALPGHFDPAVAGLYPAREIMIPSNLELQDLINNSSRKPGRSTEDVIWAINGDLTKRIFDDNPGHEFYLEESVALPWMYPHLVPHGVILKIERNPKGEWSNARQTEIIRRDRAFWNQYMDRLIGQEVVQPDTSLEDILQWVHRVYIRRNLSGHTAGQRRFLRSYVAQRAFSKQRMSLADLYDWRARNIDNIIKELPFDESRAERLQQLLTQKQELISEADYAYRQALALCPASSQTVSKYMSFLAQHQDYFPPDTPPQQRASALKKDAKARAKAVGMVVETFRKMDPSDSLSDAIYRSQLQLQVRRLYSFGNVAHARELLLVCRNLYRNFMHGSPQLTELVSFDQRIARKDFTGAHKQISSYLPHQNPTHPMDWATLSGMAIVISGNLELIPGDLKFQSFAAQIFRLLRVMAMMQAQANIIPKATFTDLHGRFLLSELGLRKQMTALEPDRSEFWYELGYTQNLMRRTNEAVQSFKKAWEVSGNTNAPRSVINIRKLIRSTNAIDNLREIPEFKEILKQP